MRQRLEAHLAGRYTVHREIGRGGMATVWLAHDERHDRPVALKVLNADLAGAIGVDRFLREIRLTARLQHPSIVPVLDSGVIPADGDPALPWYAMAYIQGESLSARLEREVQLPIDETLRIACDVGRALDVAHREGVIHRDIKPANILLADGRVYVVDFGVAKALADTPDERLTNTGLALGTPVYMSPEQASAGVVDARTDQYGLAAVVYEMLTGEPPFTGPTSHAILVRRLSEPARPLRSVRSTIPERVERAVLKALERVPADRFSDISQFVIALESTEPSSYGGGARGKRGSRMVGAVAALAVIAGVSAWAVFGNRAGVAGAPDPETVQLYQRGVRSYEQRSTVGAINAIQSFSRAISRDSNYSAAWAGLAKTYVRVVERQFPIPGLKPDSVLELAHTAIDRAIELDSANAAVWVGRAAVSRLVDPTDVRSSVHAATKAIALDSANGQAWHFLALGLAEQGDMQRALAAWREGVARNPSYTLGLFFLGQGYFWHHQYDSAAAWADSSVRVDENYLSGRLLLGQAEVERGNFDRALAAFDATRRVSTDVEAAHARAGQALAHARRGQRQQARAILMTVDSSARKFNPTGPHTAIWIAESFAAVGDADHAIEWLKRYPAPTDLHYQLHLRCDVTLDPIRLDPRFRALVIEMPNAAC